MTAESPQVRIDINDPTPPYEQLRRQMADLIMAGVLEQGRRLPPIRQLAGDLGLAPGTVARAYSELEASDLVESRRGAGTRVKAATRTAADERLGQAAADLVRLAARLGLSGRQAVAAVTEAARAAGQIPPPDGPITANSGSE